MPDATQTTHEPRDLMDVLARLEQARQEPQVERQRRFHRYPVRGEAILEPINEQSLQQPITVLLRDISQGGAGFLVERFLEPCSQWRLRFRAHGRIVGAQPCVVRFCRLIQDGLYLAGCQYIIEPYVMAMLGVPAKDLEEETLCGHSERDVCQFIPPDEAE